MQFKVIQAISNNVWSLLFINILEELSENDRQLMLKFGEPLINVGGVFLSDTSDQFSFPNEYIKLRKDFPYKRNFDSRDAPFDTNLLTKVEAYREAILARVVTGIAQLRLNNDTFTGERVISIDNNYYFNANTLQQWVVGEIPLGTINGVNQVFTVSKPVNLGNIVIYYNGLRITPNEFILVSLYQFMLINIPLPGDCIVVDFITSI